MLSQKEIATICEQHGLPAGTDPMLAADELDHRLKALKTRIRQEAPALFASLFAWRKHE